MLTGKFLAIDKYFVVLISLTWLENLGLSILCRKFSAIWLVN